MTKADPLFSKIIGPGYGDINWPVARERIDFGDTIRDVGANMLASQGPRNAASVMLVHGVSRKHDWVKDVLNNAEKVINKKDGISNNRTQEACL